MSELIQEYTVDVRDDAGRLYTARVRREVDAVGHWQGWLEHVDVEGGEEGTTWGPLAQDLLRWGERGRGRARGARGQAASRRAGARARHPPGARSINASGSGI